MLGSGTLTTMVNSEPQELVELQLQVALQRLIASGLVRFDEGASDCGTAAGESLE